MEEASKVRLVRCPKCGNILAEHPNFSVFQCGGCLAVLQAKNKEVADDEFSEVPCEGGRRGVDEKGVINVNLDSAMRNEEENDEMYGREEEGSQFEETILNGHSAVGIEERDNMAYSDRTRQGGGMDDPRYSQGRRIAFRDNIDYGGYLRNSIGDPAQRNQVGMYSSEVGHKFANSSLEDEIEGISPPVRSRRTMSAINEWSMARNGSVSSLRNGANFGQQGGFVKHPYSNEGPSDYETSSYYGYGEQRYTESKDGLARVRRPGNDHAPYSDKRPSNYEASSYHGYGEQMRYTESKDGLARVGRPENDRAPYSDEGPSNYETSSYHGHGEQMRYVESKDGLARVRRPENERAELLQKIDELKEQISKSGEMAQRPGERVFAGRRPLSPADPYSLRDAYMPEGFQFDFEKQDLHSDKYFHVPTNLTPGHGRSPSIQRPDLGSSDSYPPNHFRNSLAGYGDAYNPQHFLRPLHQPSHQYSQRTYIDRFPDDHMSFNPDHFMPHPQETTAHQRSYSSSHSMNKNWYGLAEIPPPIPSILRSRNDPTNVAPYLHSNSTARGPRSYRSEGSHSLNQYHFARPPRPENYQTGSFHHQPPKQPIVSKGGAHVYRPIAGGSPFITCLHCFMLLKMPLKVIQGTNQGKLKCGACSSIFVLECGAKGIVLSISGDDNHALEKITPFSDDLQNDMLQSAHDHSDSVPKQSLEEQWSSSSEFEKMQSCHIPRSSLSENEEIPENVIVRKDVTYPAKLLLEDNALLRFEGVPHMGRPDPLQTENSVNLHGEVNKAEGMVNKNSIFEQNSSSQGSMKDSPVASEMDMSVNDYTNSVITHVSTEVSKEGSKSKINKFAGIVKRSFKDFARSGHGIENVKSSILINGHMIPDRLLKKAEKVAGPIQHGEYWYDYRAGFWGVMGHPCMGVIPPKIEEFNFPMPEDCSNGNTKVFVNGRELHQKDLDLLSSRGLPITRHKYYLIEISGNVVDEQTGRELESLGKLAPTVESVGHGFGMRIPKAISQGQ